MQSDFAGLPRLEDVAREAGVSASTASRVLNGNRPVADGYRQRVLAAARLLGYTANLAAQATARGRYPAVGLVVGDISDQFFARVASGVIHESSKRGLVVNIVSTDGDAGRELEVIRELRRQRPQSLVLVRKRDSTPAANAGLVVELQSFEREGGRVVVVGESSRPMSAIRPPDFDGGKELARALTKLGYRSFAAVTSADPVRSSDDRIDGFRAGLSAAGIALADRDVYSAHSSLPGGMQAAAQYLASGRTVELIFAIEDMMALGVLYGLERAGISVPKDIAVAGYGGRRMETVDLHGLDLTTVRAPLEEMGAAAVSMTVENDEPAVIGLQPEVILRASTPPR